MRVRRALRALSVAWLVFLLVPLSSTGLDFPVFSVTFVITVLVAVVSLAVELTRRPVKGSWLAVWLLHPLAAASLVLLFLASQSPANPLFRLRFQLSRPSLEAAAGIVRSGRPFETPTWVGLFPVRRIDVVDSLEIHFVSDGCGVVDECGLLYRPGAMPAGRHKTKVKHLDGSWYHLYAVF